MNGQSTGSQSHDEQELDREALEADLIRDEGIRLRPYLDCCGRYWRDCVTVPCKPAREGHRGKLTIGIGRNLDDVGISADEAMYLFSRGPTNDLSKAIHAAANNLAFWPKLDGVRKRALANMTFNMGIRGLLEFHHTLTAIGDGDWAEAVRGLKSSLWALQVGKRAERIETMIGTGEPA